MRAGISKQTAQMMLRCIFLSGSIIIGFDHADGQPFLSALQATKNDPIFTTYAAARARSEYIIDEGYQFSWNDPERPLGFETDNGGSLLFAWKKNGIVRSQLGEYYRAPVVTASYSDIVRFYYYPFEKLRVDVFFLVYSSRAAVQDMHVTNESDGAVNISAYPIFMNMGTRILKPSLLPENDGVSFTHREPPDDWMIDHSIPYKEHLRDVYLIDTTIDSYGGYSAWGGETQSKISVSKANLCVEWGLVQHADGSLCTHTPPYAQQIILHNNSDQEILTESAPKWGDVDPNIPGNGYQGCELGNFRSPSIAAGDSFTVLFTCSVKKEQGIAGGKIPQLPAAGGIRTDLSLHPFSAPDQPQNVNAHFSQNNSSSVIAWTENPDVVYSVFRRTTNSPGRYNKIGSAIKGSGYLDMGLSPDSVYGYIVVAQDSLGNRSGHSREVGNIIPRTVEMLTDISNSNLSNTFFGDSVSVIALQKNFTIGAGQSVRLRIVRSVSEESTPVGTAAAYARTFRGIDLAPFLKNAEDDYARIPKPAVNTPDAEMLYWNSFSLLRQCMMPAEGQLQNNYYVFSREPQWGWGHGGQVFHESLAMLAYVYMDPLSAMNSQRVYFERQSPDGYINYRTGPYLNETIPFADSKTTSAPWLSWENWEIFQVTGDTLFLRESYEHGKLFYSYLLTQRDADKDTLCEWGAHAMLECVRDGLVAVWDKVGWPSNFEALDLNTMLVSEAHSLSEMAHTLGNEAESVSWKNEAKARSARINATMWDEQSGFYYHVSKTGHTFSYKNPDDLKRKEIIGFLPLWAGIANQDQSKKMVTHLLNPAEFWRKNGIPSLSANDPYYNPSGYWNGPVWVQWQYLVFRGLLRYGYKEEAKQLFEKVSAAMIKQLKQNHWFWELYSPDTSWAGWNKTYIWAAIVARMMIDLEKTATVFQKAESSVPVTDQLLQNYPNPFNGMTNYEFRITNEERVTIKVFDMLGREIATVVDERMSAGEHTIRWNTGGLPSGMYLYKIQSGSFSAVKKMVLLK